MTTHAEIELIGHLMRRAGFGAPAAELERLAARGYDAVVEDLLHPERFPEPDMDLFDRFQPERADHVLRWVAMPWLFRMVTTKRPLQEKLALLWHDVFATGVAKVMNPPMMLAQYQMLYTHALGSFRTILQRVSRDPAMAYWLDQQTSHAKAANENYGRELLELFSMGVGNYTEDDVRSCAEAFTGWTIEQVITRLPWTAWYPAEFVYREDDHDHRERTFLGERGDFNGDEIIDIILRQPANARFVARRLYDFFVSDTPNEEHIETLASAYTASGHEIRDTMRVLLHADFFKSSAGRKMRSPAEVLVGTLRLTGEYADPYDWNGFHRSRTPEGRGLSDEARWGELRWHHLYRTLIVMGQELLNPPSVEGWHTGREWINTSSLTTRVNFAAERLGNPEAPGVGRMVERIAAGRSSINATELVDACRYELGGVRLRDRTRRIIAEELGFAQPIPCDPPGGRLREAAADAFRLISASPEYQLA